MRVVHSSNKNEVAVCKNPQQTIISSERPSDDIAGVACIVLHIKVCNAHVNLFP